MARVSAAACVRYGLACACLVLLLQSAAALVAALGFGAYDSIVDLDRNNGVPDVISTLVVLAAAAGAGAVSVVGQSRFAAGALALVLALVVVYDVLQEEPDAGTVRGDIVIVTVVLAAVLILVVARAAPRSARRTLLVGLVLLLVAVKAAWWWDQMLNILQRGDLGRGDVEYELGIVVKQGLEVFGWSCVAIGLWATALDAAQHPRERRLVPASGPPLR